MNYSESMSKRQQRRKALNQRFRRMFLVALLMGLVMGFIFGRCSAVNSKAPDAPIEPDQLTAVTPDVTLEPVEIPLVEEPAEPEPVLLGSFRITAYCSCEKCCGEWAKNRPNGIEYQLKNEQTGHFHCWRKSDDKLFQFYAGTGKIQGFTQVRGIHSLIQMLEG